MRKGADNVQDATKDGATMRAIVSWILDHRALVVLGLLSVTLVLGWLVATRGVFGSSVGKLFFGESPRYERYLEYGRELGTDEIIVIGLEDVDILAPETLDRLERVVTRIAAIGVDMAPAEVPPPVDPVFDDEFAELEEGFDETEDTPSQVGVVRRVRSVLSARRVRRQNDVLTTRSYAELAREQPEQREALLQELIADDLAAGALISDDGRHAAVIIEMVPDENRAAEAVPAIVDEVRAIFVEEGFPAERLHRGGMPAIMAEMFQQTISNVTFIFPITVLVLTLTVLLLFRRLWPPILAAVAAGMGVVWTMGVSVLIDPQISIMHSIAPMVMLIVATSDVIHLCSAYLLELGNGKEKRQAIVDSASEVGRACLYTSMTTFVGFVGLSFVPTPVFRQLGIILGSGVAFALFIAVTIVPIALSVLPKPSGWKTEGDSRVQAALDRLLAGLMRVSVRKPWAVIAFFCVVAALTVFGLSQLHIETALSRRLSPDNPVSMDREWFEEHFASSNVVQLVLDTGKVDGIQDPTFLRNLVQLQEEVDADPGVDAAYSVVDVLGMLHEQLTGEARGLPEEPLAPAEYLMVLESRDRNILNGLADFERRKAVLSIRLQEEGVRAGYDKGLAIEARARELLGPGVGVESTGMQFLTGEWLGSIVAGQRRGLAVTFVVILGMMIFGLRSLRAGAWSMLPNALPLLMLGGWLGLSTDAVDSDTLVLAMLAIGIGVDDTIHFLMRYRLEVARDNDPEAALERTYRFAGRAIVITTLVLTLGFLPFALSDYLSVSILGTLLPMTLFFALIADLLLVPALAAVGWLRFTSPSGE